MFDKLRSILSKADADYADLRYEIKKETSVLFTGKELTQIGSSSTDGFVLRILKRGGFSSIAFTKESDAEKCIRISRENALLIAKSIDPPVALVSSEPLKETSLAPLVEDPRKVSIEEKLELTRQYNNIALGQDGIATTTTDYMELEREKYFVNTDGTEIREDLVTLRLGGSITAKEGTLVQNVRVGVGGSNGFQLLRNKEEEFEKKTSIALQLLKAKPVQGGVYNVVLNPSMAGVFTHEAFGHFSEADLIEDNPTIRDKMKIGANLGNDVLNITDDPTMPNQLGFYRFDDEGVRARPARLMEKGVLTGRLHSRRTAAAFGEPLSGHCVAEDYRYAPIIRMGSIFIEPGTSSVDDLLSIVDDGLYLLDHMGGQTGGENFTFGAQYGYIVKGGRITDMIRDINMSGNLYHTLQTISAVGNDLVLSKTGGCGKGQMNYHSCNGGPHILIKGVVIGGR